MALHRLTQVVLAVPNPAETAGYYYEFGLVPSGPISVGSEHVLRTQDGGDQLRIIQGSRRRATQIGIGVDDQDDLDRIAASLARLGIATQSAPMAIRVFDAGSQVEFKAEIAPRIVSSTWVQPLTNGPGGVTRLNTRADAVLRTRRVQPRKLGHVVIGSTDQLGSERLLMEGIGLKLSDRVAEVAAFMRCSTDHHNVLVQQAPVPFVHHTSWQVDDVDEIGRGATAMLEGHPERHVWGLGRHHIGSNFFWYLRDPSGTFSEYYSDLDCIVDDQLWSPGDWNGRLGLYNWGPPPPPSFVTPDDLAELMTGSHGPGAGSRR